MGRDKATLRLRDGTLLGQRAVDALRGCDGIDDDVAVVGADPHVAEALGARWVADPSPPSGPVGGVLAALQDAARRGQEAVVVLPCDLPVVLPEHVESLLAAARPAASSVVIASVGERAAYPIGVWPITVVASIEAALRDGPVDFATALAHAPPVLVAMPDAFRDADEPGHLTDGGLV
jgi:molybdopterin-guanine dinucleotide biosynthesis protein A